MTVEAVGFQNALCYDGKHPLSLMDTIIISGEFGGIHSFDFASAIEDDFTSSGGDWSVFGGSWNISGTLTGSGAGGSSWYQIRHTKEVKPSFVALFDFVSGRGGFVFKGNSTTQEAYVAYWNESYTGFHKVASDGSVAILSRVPYVITPPARMLIAVKYSLDSFDDDKKILQASLWVDGQCITAMGEDISDSDPGDQVGFVVYGSDSFTVDNFIVPELHRIVEWLMFDTGQPVASGMSRAIGSTRVMYWSRFDESMRVRRPGDREVDVALDDDLVLRFMGRTNQIGIVTHARTQAAMHEVDYFRNTDADQFMHGFALKNDPNIMSDDEAYTESKLSVKDALESRRVVHIAYPINPLIEPHDRISVLGDDYRVVSLSSAVDARKGDITVRSVLTCKKYISESEV